MIASTTKFDRGQSSLKRCKNIKGKDVIKRETK
jgi:hypothetical protein